MSFPLVRGEIGGYAAGPEDVVFATANGRIFPQEQGVTPEWGERRCDPVA